MRFDMLNLTSSPILNNKQLKCLGAHKYSCESNSILDSYFQPWWNFLTQCLPLWLAPNLITLAGLVVNILTSLILFWYSPDGLSYVPRWASFLCALGIFIYQSLDAVDGKQARRTQSSSPLGELFDHGCDSISTVFVAIAACISVNMGEYPNWMFYQCFCAICLFYCAHWQTYVCGTLKFGKVDVTEAQVTIICMHLGTALFGVQFWQYTLFHKFETRFIIALMTIVCCSITLRYMIEVILTCGAGKNGSTVADTSVLGPIIPLFLFMAPAIFMKIVSPQLYEQNPVIFILTFGLVAARTTNRLVVAHMSKSEMCYTDPSMLGPYMLVLNSYFNKIFPEKLLLYLCLLWSVYELIRFEKIVCLEICKFLNIELFRIKILSFQDINKLKNNQAVNPNSKRILRSNKR